MKAFLDRPRALAFLRVRKEEALIDPEWLWLEICAAETRQHPSDFAHANSRQLGSYFRGALFQHARKAEETTPESSFTILDPLLTPEVLQFFRPKVEGKGLTARTDIASKRGSDTSLSVAAEAGLVKFCRDKIKAGADPNENGGRVLEAAIGGLREDVVNMLLGHDLVIDDSHIIEALKKRMSLSTVQAMLKRVTKGPIKLTNHLGQSIKPLYAVASTPLRWDGRAEHLFRYFLHLGEGINDLSGPEGTALHAAIRSGFRTDLGTLIRRLDFMLRCGADINSQGPGIPDDLDRPLDLAFELRCPHLAKIEVLEFLISSRGAKSANLDMIKERIQDSRKGR